MKKLSAENKRFLYGGHVNLLAPVVGTMTNGLLNFPIVSNAAIGASTPGLLASSAPLAVNSGIINFDPFQKNDVSSMIRKTQQIMKDNEKNTFSSKKEGLLKRISKNMTDYGGWNTAMLIGSGISVGTGLATNALNIAESLKEQPKRDPMYDLANEPLMHARFY